MLESNFVNNPIVLGMKINSDAESVSVDETYYKKIVGSLMYLTSTRTSVRYATSLLNMYMERHTKLHLKFATQISKRNILQKKHPREGVEGLHRQ